MTVTIRGSRYFFWLKTMARKKAKPQQPIFKVKPLKVKRFSVKIPKLPNIKASRIKI